MTPSQRQTFRSFLLTSAAGAGRFGISEELIFHGARASGFHSVTQEEIGEEIQYLVDKGFLVAVDKQISPENKSWRVTAEGRDWLAQQGLA